MALEIRIISGRAETTACLLAQLAIANLYAENGTPYKAEPALAELGKNTERALAGIVAEIGGAS